MATSAQDLIDIGIAKTRDGRFGEAGLAFLHALRRAGDDAAGEERGILLGQLANQCVFAEHPDIGLMALAEILEDEGRRADPGRRCSDLLALANCWTVLGRGGAAAEVNEQALDHARRHGRHADAASASTNLASTDAANGRLDAALDRLKESLALLEKEGNPDTEAVTRLSYLQVADALGSDPEPALAVVRDIFTRLERHVGPARWNRAAPAFHRLVDRHVAAHPELDGERWKRETFPLVFGEPGE